MSQKIIKILIADSTGPTCDAICSFLTGDDNFQVVGRAVNADECLSLALIKRPDLVILPNDLKPSSGIEVCEQLVLQNPGVATVLVLQQALDENLFRRMMLVGVGEFLIAPLQKQRTLEAINNVIEKKLANRPSAAAESEPEQRKKVISIIGARGGCGQTSIAVNLGCAIALSTSAGPKNKQVVLADLNVRCADAATFLDVSPSRTLADIAPSSHGVDRDVIDTLLEPHETGLQLLSAGAAEPYDRMELSRGTVISTLAVLRDEFPFTIVDMAEPGSEVTEAALDFSDQILMVVGMDLPRLQAARRYVQHLLEGNCPREKILVVLNDFLPKSEVLTTEQAETILELPVALRIPYDGNLVSSAVNLGKPFVLTHPNKPVARAIFSLMEKIGAGAAKSGGSTGGAGAAFAKLRSMLGRSGGGDTGKPQRAASAPVKGSGIAPSPRPAPAPSTSQPPAPRPAPVVPVPPPPQAVAPTSLRSVPPPPPAVVTPPPAVVAPPLPTSSAYPTAMAVQILQMPHSPAAAKPTTPPSAPATPYPAAPAPKMPALTPPPMAAVSSSRSAVGVPAVPSANPTSAARPSTVSQGARPSGVGMPAPRPSAVAIPIPHASAPLKPGSPARSTVDVQAIVRQKNAKNKKHLLVAAIAGIAVLAAGSFFFFGQSSKPATLDVQTFMEVPAGEFIYQDQPPDEERKKTKQFWISKYEVTIGQYKDFWNHVQIKGDTEYADPQQPAEKDRTHTPLDWDQILNACQTGTPYMGQKITLECPVFNVDYYDARAYAKYAGGRLPNELEWEKAGRGLYGRQFPWGNQFDPKAANGAIDNNPSSPGTVDGYFAWAPVNAHPVDASPYGVRDMAGNVSEWTSSWVPMKSDPKQKVPVIRGGSWADKDLNLLQRRFDTPANQRLNNVGIRIVVDNEPPVVGKP